MAENEAPPKDHPIIACPECEHLMSVPPPRLIILNSADISVLTMIHEPINCVHCRTEFQTSINEQTTNVMVGLAAKPKTGQHLYFR